MMTLLIKVLVLSLCILALAVIATAQTKYEKATFRRRMLLVHDDPVREAQGRMQVVAGYIGGTGENPTYEDYAEKGLHRGGADDFDPAIISITHGCWTCSGVRLIRRTPAGSLWTEARSIDPRSSTTTTSRNSLAEKSKQKLQASGRFAKPIVTEILKASTFYKAEEYHQDYYKKNPIRYKFYRSRSGRDAYLDKVWGKDRDQKRR